MSLEDFQLRYESVKGKPLDDILNYLNLDDSEEIRKAFNNCPERVRPYLLFGFSQEQFVPVRPVGPRKLHSKSLEVKKNNFYMGYSDQPKNTKTQVNKIFSSQLQSNSFFQQRV